jgi:hypothetical protein
MTTIESIYRMGLAEEKGALTTMKAGLGLPPFLTADQQQASIRLAEQNIAKAEQVLDGGLPALMAWWEGLDEMTRDGLRNM